jgi:hypothetical protein
MIRKFAVTGHTKRIGKALYFAFPSSLGFSKSNGYDITNKNDRIKIIREAIDCDVFINNAHEGFAQVELLNEIFDAWKMEDKLIINIGVDSVPFTNWQVVHKQYPVEKMALHAQCEMLHNNVDRKCKITNLALGYVDTEFNEEYKGPKLSYAEIINTVKWITEQQSEIKHIVLSAK